MNLALHQDNDGGCFYCGEAMFFLDPGLSYDGLGKTEQGPDVASEDHVTPINHGGTKHRSNVVVVHRQCNSIKGDSPPTPAMLERLAELNIRRGFVIPDVPGTMTPDTFFPPAETTKAMHYVCELLNAIEGKEGIRARSKFAKRIDRLLEMRGSLRAITNERIRIRLFEMVEKEISATNLFDDELLNTLTLNVTKSMVKAEKQVIMARKMAETQARKELKLERKRLKREGEQPLSQTS